MSEMGFMLAIELNRSETERCILAVEQGLPFDCASDGATMRVVDGMMLCERTISNPDLALHTTAELAAELVLGAFKNAISQQQPIETSFHFPTALTIAQGYKVLRALDADDGTLSIVHKAGVFEITKDSIRLTSNPRVSPTHKISGTLSMGAGPVERAYIRTMLEKAVEHERSLS
jgi:hypothetical protein